MKWVADTTGRFQWRPSYQPEELDTECERTVTAFLLDKYGTVRFPISTDDLTVMIERDTSYLDLYADLSAEGEDVEGLTDFFKDKKPAVKISKDLSADASLCGRLRTTLAHEYGHVKFHNFLWDIAFRSEQKGDFWKRISRQRRKIEDMRKKSAPSHGISLYGINSYPPLSPGEPFSIDSEKLIGPRCSAALILDAPAGDWMEWQAGYIGGAFLMPVSPLKQYIREHQPGKPEDVIAGVAAVFDVSPGTAEMRLSKLGFLKTPV